MCVRVAVLFRADRRDYPNVMAAAASGYLIARFGGLAFGSSAGIFLAALVTAAAGNAYARWWHRPGAILRVPGIIMLVPGSASLRGLLELIQQQDITAGQDALAALNILLARLPACWESVAAHAPEPVGAVLNVPQARKRRRGPAFSCA
jgi:uncharacterized membrane protein YjjB (DUF3815 family)